MKDKDKQIEEMLYIKQNGECYIDKNCKWQPSIKKEKQIEEIAKERNEIKDIMKLLDKCVSLNPMCKSEVASVIYGNNYQKITKDNVVLSREEYKRLKRVETEKDRLYEIKLDLENQLIEKGWTDYEGADEIEKRVSKETAEKCIRDIREMLQDCDKVYEDDGYHISPDVGYLKKDVDDGLNKIAKQLGVEVK